MMMVAAFAVVALSGGLAHADSMWIWIWNGCPNDYIARPEEFPQGKDQAIRTQDGRVIVTHLDTLYSMPESCVANVKSATIGKPFWFKWATPMGNGKCGSFSDQHSTMTNI